MQKFESYHGKFRRHGVSTFLVPVLTRKLEYS